MEELPDSVVFSRSMGNDQAQKIVTKLTDFENRHLDDLKNLPGMEKISFDKEKLVAWVACAEKVLNKISFSNAHVPKLEEFNLIRSNNAHNKDNILAETNIISGINIIIGYGIEIVGKDENVLRQIVLHEVGHYPQLILLKPSDSQNIQENVQAVGFDRTVGIDYSFRGDSFIRKGILTEPLAELFSYFCTVEAKEPIHEIVSYSKETLFTLSLLEKIADINQSSVLDEYGKLYKAFATRDFSWYKHLSTTYTNYYLSLGLNEEEARSNTTDYIKSLNTIVSIRGVDTREQDRQEYQLSEVDKKGGFLDEYNQKNTIVESGNVLSIEGFLTKIKTLS